MEKGRWFNIVLFLIIILAGSYGVWDHWFRSKEVLAKKISPPKSQLQLPANPFSDEDMQSYHQIKILHNTGNYEGALNLAQKLLASEDGEPQFREWLLKQVVPLMTSVAWLKIQMGECDEALKILYKTIKIQPIPETKKALGYCLHAAKNWPEAASWLSSYVFEKPADYDGRLLLADAMESLGRFDEALLSLEGNLSIEGLTDAQKSSLAERIQAMKVKAREGTRQKSEYSRRFYVSFREEEHEHLLPAVFEILESAMDEFTEILGVEPSDSPIEVVLYRNEAFHEVIPGGPDWSEGVFDGRIRVPITADMKSHPNRLLATILRHELLHAVLSRRVKGRNLPSWIEEGLAQYMSCRRRECDGFKFGVSPGRFLTTQKLTEPFVSLTNIEAGMAYQQSLYLVRMIISVGGEDVLKQISRDIPQSGTLTSEMIVHPAGFQSFEAFVTEASTQWMKKTRY